MRTAMAVMVGSRPPHAAPALPLLVLALALAAARRRGRPRAPGRPCAARPAPGPARYDRVWVREFGPANAKRVLVLVPGHLGGVGDFTLVARDIVARVPGLAVWAIDRREQAFEDTSVFATGDLRRGLRYYLSLQPVGGRTFKPVDGAKVPFVRQWGLSVALEDLRRVVLRARDGGRRKVILGGHSLGASTTVAYAAWDFHGPSGLPRHRGHGADRRRPGGHVHHAQLRPRPRAPGRRCAEATPSRPCSPACRRGRPAPSPRSGALYALKRPQEPSVLQDFPLLPAILRPPFRVTNEAAYGYAFDATTSPPDSPTCGCAPAASRPPATPGPGRTAR